MTDLFEVMKA